MTPFADPRVEQAMNTGIKNASGPYILFAKSRAMAFDVSISSGVINV